MQKEDTQLQEDINLGVTPENLDEVKKWYAHRKELLLQIDKLVQDENLFNEEI